MFCMCLIHKYIYIFNKEMAQPNRDKQYINVDHLNLVSKVTIPHKSLLTFKKVG